MSLLNDASLVFIPSGYKEDKVYSVIPSNGAGDLDFVRGCDATRINPQSLVENTPWNLFNDTEDFTFGTWSKVSTTVTANTTVAPNGAQTADTAVISSGGYIYYQLNYSGTTGSSISMSVYSKTSTTNLLVFGGATIAGTDTEQILSVGNGWYRHIVTRVFTTTASGIVQFVLGFYTPGTHIIWGAQLNAGTIKPYFPTTDRLNVPRLTYSPTLIERQSTNLVLYSQDFNNGYWLGSATKTANTTTAPDGTTTADTLGEVASNVTQNAASGLISFVSGTSYTMSIYAKNTASGRGFIQLAGYGLGTSGANVHANFNLNNGTTSNVTGGTATITDISNGWYRCSFTFTSQATTSERYNATLISSASAISFEQYTGDTSKSIYIWGAQLETGSLTSYIPTTSTAVTRVASYNSGCPSLLLEKQSTNLALYSEDFTQSAYTKVRTSITSNSTVSPDGTINASKVESTSTGGAVELYQRFTLSAIPYCASVYMKKGSGDTQMNQFHIYGTSAYKAQVNINFANGTITQPVGSGATIESVGNEWYRINIPFTADAGFNYFYIGSSGSYFPSGQFVYAWGFQLEASTYPTSYIPTTSATVTRLRDSCSKTGISSLIGQTEGTLFVDINNVLELDVPQLTIDDGTNNNRIVLYRSPTNGYISIFISVAGTNTNYSSTTSSSNGKIAIAYNNTGFVVYLNGTQILSFANSIPGNMSAIRLNGRATNDFYTVKNINQFLLFKRRLTNTELANLTTL